MHTIAHSATKKLGQKTWTESSFDLASTMAAPGNKSAPLAQWKIVG